MKLGISQKDLWRLTNLYYDKGLYSPVTSSLEYFEASWYDLSKAFNFPPTVKEQVESLLAKVPTSGKKLGVVVAAAVYTVTSNLTKDITMKSIADYFGVTEISVRNAGRIFKGL